MLPSRGGVIYREAWRAPPAPAVLTPEPRGGLSGVGAVLCAASGLLAGIVADAHTGGRLPAGDYALTALVGAGLALGAVLLARAGQRV